MTTKVAEPSAVRTVRLSGASSSLTLQGATVLDGRGGTVRNATVRIDGQRITSISTGPSSNTGDRSLQDVSGRWIIPGLVDTHLHLAPGARAVRNPDHFRQRDDGLALLQASLAYERMLLAGITTVRSLGGEPAETAVAIRRAMLDEFLIGPRVLTAGTSVLMGRGRADVRLVSAVKVARNNFGHLADVVMLGDCQITSRPAFALAELRELVEEAHRRRIRIALRPVSQAEALVAIKAGIDSIDGLPRDADARLPKAMRGTGIALTPLLSSSPRRARHGDVIAAAVKAGVPITTGSGWSLKRPQASLALEIAALRDAGLSAEELIAATTSNGATALGLGDDTGALEPGKLADLVVLRADPTRDPTVLADARQVDMVVQASDPLTS